MPASVCSRVLLRLVHVEFADDADLELSFDDPQGLALEIDVFRGVLDSLLGRAVRHVVRRHIAQERDQHVVVIINRGVQAGRIGLDGPPQAAPEVQFPTQVEPVVPLRVEAIQPRRERIGILRLVRCWCNCQSCSASAGRGFPYRSTSGPALPARGRPPRAGRGSAGTRCKSVNRVGSLKTVHHLLKSSPCCRTRMSLASIQLGATAAQTGW